jgi:hypothetical protein
MIKKILLSALLLTLTTGLALAEADRWLHVRVLDGEDKVSVNLPVDLVATVLGSIEDEHFRHGAIQFDDMDVDRELLTAILAAAVESKDGEFVRIEEGDEAVVSVHKKKDTLFIDIEEDHEKVKVQVPLTVVRAMLKGEGDVLDIAAALEALGAGKGNTLVTVDDGDATVRVWVDSSMEGI